ncbi:8137_t:CDS:2 [Entrophospora sp. SA101]|nr:8137_t:CDS:2 [Entrophospora sp. SA101]
MDWAVTFFNSKNIPTFLSKAPDLPHLRSQSDDNLLQKFAHKNDNDDDNMDIDDDPPKHLIFMGQDKKFIVTSLTQSMKFLLVSWWCVIADKRRRVLESMQNEHAANLIKTGESIFCKDFGYVDGLDVVSGK